MLQFYVRVSPACSENRQGEPRLLILLLFLLEMHFTPNNVYFGKKKKEEKEEKKRGGGEERGGRKEVGACVQEKSCAFLFYNTFAALFILFS